MWQILRGDYNVSKNSKNSLFVYSVKCPIRWYCRVTKRYVEVSEDSVYSVLYGWICDCGVWIKGVDKFHSSFIYGERRGYKE